MSRRYTLALILAVTTGGMTAAAQPAAGPPVGTVQVTLLGTGNPRPSMERFGQAILIEAGPERLLIDAGRGAAQRLFALGGREALVGVGAVFFTHLHSDHVVGLPDLWLTSWIFGRDKALEVAGPPGTADMSRHLEQAYQWDITMRTRDEGFPREGVRLAARDVAPGVVFDRNGVRVTAFAVEHGGVTGPAYGYRVDYGGRSVAVSGDTVLYEPMLEQVQGVDVFVHEVISPEVEMRRAAVPDPEAVKKILAHHTGPDQVGTLFTRAKIRLGVLSHIVPSPTTAEDLLGPIRRTYSGPLAIGYDLMTIVIGQTVDVFPRRTLSDR